MNKKNFLHFQTIYFFIFFQTKQEKIFKITRFVRMETNRELIDRRIATNVDYWNYNGQKRKRNLSSAMADRLQFFIVHNHSD